jgi:hypothetical protein
MGFARAQPVLLAGYDRRHLPGVPPEAAWTTLASARPGALASVNLAADQRDGALIDLSRVPGLDDREIGFARLVARAGLPAVGLKEIRRRAKRVGGDVEIAGAHS